MDKEKSQRIKLIVSASVLLVLIIGVAIRMIVYSKVGEKKMPYSVSKIIVISTANKYEKEKSAEETEEKAEETAEENTEEQNEEAEVQEENQEEEATEEQSAETPLWEFDVVQTNDIYISIAKNEANIKKNEKIKSVAIKNISIDEKPAKGNMQAYMPNSVEGEKFVYKKDYEVNNSLTYRAAEEGNFKDLQIYEDGGIIAISIANVGFDTLSSNDEEINYNGKLLEKLGLKDEDLKSKVSFDLIIELDDGKEYCARISVDMDCKDLVENGTSTKEITDFSNIVYKRK